MTASNEPRVSDEDRQEAKILLARAYCMAQFQYDEGNYATAADMQRAIGADTRASAESRLIAAQVAALVSHGWGPKPAVSATRIDEYMEVAVLGRGVSASAAVRELLRECGIEVTEDEA